MRRHFTVDYRGDNAEHQCAHLGGERDQNPSAMIRTARNGVFNVLLVTAFAVCEGLYTHETLPSASWQRRMSAFTDASLQRPLCVYRVIVVNKKLT